MLNIALIAGSNRPDSQSAKVARYLRQRLIDLGLSSDSLTSLIDLGERPLPQGPSENAPNWPEHAAKLRAADGVVIVAPEFHGMASPALKNFFLYATKAELAHKPGLLVGISAGPGGAYPISELRASGYKNCRLCYLPEHLIIRYVNQVLNDTQALDEEDRRIRQRADYALDILARYAEALKPVRAAIDMGNPAFANGM